MRYSHLKIITEQTKKTTVPIPEYTLTSPEIKSFIAKFSKMTGQDPADVTEMIVSKADSVNNKASKSPKLYSGMKASSLYQACYQYMRNDFAALYDPLDNTIPKFDFKIFRQLIKLFMADNPRMFGREGSGLRPMHSDKVYYDIVPIFTPQKADSPHADFNRCKTAMVTSNGYFVFNKNFIRELIAFSWLSDFKPKRPHYQCNGGPIPDHYGFIEFLIAHECYHMYAGDLNPKRLKSVKGVVDPNIVADLRINSALYQRGLPMIPIGWISDEFNYKNYPTWKELYLAVDEAWRLLPKEYQATIEEESRGGDDHPEDDNPPKPPKLPEVGDIGINKETGEFGKIISINKKTHSYEIEPMTKAEVEKIYPGVKV